MFLSVTSTSCYKPAVLTCQSLLYSCMFSAFASVSCLTSTHHVYFSRDDVTTRPMSTSTPSHTRHSLNVSSCLPLASSAASVDVRPQIHSPYHQPFSFTGLCRTKLSKQLKLSNSLNSGSRSDGTSPFLSSLYTPPHISLVFCSSEVWRFVDFCTGVRCR